MSTVILSESVTWWVTTSFSAGRGACAKAGTETKKANPISAVVAMRNDNDLARGLLSRVGRMEFLNLGVEEGRHEFASLYMNTAGG